MPAGPATNLPNPDDALDAPGAEHRQFVIRRHLDQRLDVYLQQRLKGVSRSRIQKLIELGGVTVNGTDPKASTAIRHGDCIDVTLPPRAVRTIEPEPIALDVIYEDDWIIVVNKQRNLIVHPARSHLSGTLLNGLAYRFRQQQEEAGKPWVTRSTRGFRRHDRPTGPGQVQGLSGVGASEFRPGIVHRLDKDTTGVIIVAKSDEGHWAIARQFENRSTLKAYLAIVHGNFDTVGGVVDAPIGKHPTIREAQAVRHDSTAKPSVTLYRVREQYAGYSLIELELKTGRTHQIRVHLSYIGHPIVGDILYGGEPIGPTELATPPAAAGSRRMLTFARSKAEGQRVADTAHAREDLLMAHPALHAALLRLAHPQTQERVTFTAPIHEPMRRLIKALRHQRVDKPVATEGYWVDFGDIDVDADLTPQVTHGQYAREDSNLQPSDPKSDALSN